MLGTGIGDGDENEQAQEEEDEFEAEGEHNGEGDESAGSVVCGEGEPMLSEDSFLPSDEELTYDNVQPVFIFYDRKATGGSIYDDNIIEIASKVIGIPNSVNTVSLVHCQMHHTGLLRLSRTNVASLHKFYMASHDLCF